MASWCIYLLLFVSYLLSLSSAKVIEAYHVGTNLEKNVSSSDIFKRYEDGHCMYPGVCDIPIHRCNIDRIPLSKLSKQQFIQDYVIPKKPVIIEMCDDPSDCDLSSILDNSSGIWEWNKMISTVRPSDYKHLYLTETNGTPKDRAETCDIHPLEDRNQTMYQPIIESIHDIPAIFEELDIFNELVGYLKYSDGPLLGNKWIIFGTTGSGATFHFDYYLTEYWNLAVEGSKFWFLIDPESVEQGFFDGNEQDLHKVLRMPLWQFWIQIYPYMTGTQSEYPYYECMQRKGDIVYAPVKWYHATVNLNATLSISRNMITRFNYKTVFEFITGLQTMHSINTKTRKTIGVHHAVDLCAALYHYDSKMWRNTICATKLFLQRLNSFPLLFEDGMDNNTQLNVWNWYYHTAKHKTNSLIYIDACNYAAKHATFSSFRT
eukprot:161654_1